ncbi:alpha-L-rhamnosidase C-terminal domain-containing protein [Maribacter sp. CXY002]|uniref:alpha-L-rhamnosidase-related protein n=1 Tax=Maribacter luteocoastalis TaxID=3407671 RepID=UPI003B677E7B
MKIFNLLLLMFFFGISSIGYGQSKAHEKSAFAIIDPSYNSQEYYPSKKTFSDKTPWIYGSAELEAYRLQLLMARKDSAKLEVGYPGIYHKPYNSGEFMIRLDEPKPLDKVTFRTNGFGTIFINEKMVDTIKQSNEDQSLSWNLTETIQNIRFSITTKEDIPALRIAEGPLNTANKDWRWKATDSIWTHVTAFPMNSENIPPHALEESSITVMPDDKSNGLFDFGKELFGYVHIESGQKPRMVIGESKTEALDIDNTVIEQTQELVKIGENKWRSKVSLAFRYVHVPNTEAVKVTCEAIFNSAKYQGAFACSDSLLTKIWMNSAYTLRLNMHDFLLDGMKRDRLPWTGDMAMSMLVNSYTFYDAELVRRSLVALGRAGIKEKDINGIVDYSVWWIIAQNQFQHYYGDEDHLKKEWARIEETLKVLESRTDEDGFIHVEKDDWLFIDWVDQEKWTALQIMWWWAQKSAVELAERMGDAKTANYWTSTSEQLKINLEKVAWDEEKNVWLSGRNTIGDYTRHPNFLAVVTGITPLNKTKGIEKLLEDDTTRPVGTPYMAGFEMMALAKMGNIDYALNRISKYWGGMISKGATSFWEAYDEKQNDPEQYSFYGRPYAKSLNHAWSAGPAAILPSQIFGLKPLEDGWKKFTLKPNLGSLKWASASVPTTYGNITIDIDGDMMYLKIPKGIQVLWKDKLIEGPISLTEKY